MFRFISLISIIFLSFLASIASVSARSGEIIKREGLTGSGEKNTQVIEKREKTEEVIPESSSSGTTQSGNINEENEGERKKIELKLKRDINAYIIESYKAQGNKIIKDLNLKLSRTLPNVEERKIALEKIQESLKSRLEKTEEIENSDSKKEILQEFLRHLIQLLDKRIEEMEK